MPVTLTLSAVNPQQPLPRLSTVRNPGVSTTRGEGPPYHFVMQVACRLLPTVYSAEHHKRPRSAKSQLIPRTFSKRTTHHTEHTAGRKNTKSRPRPVPPRPLCACSSCSTPARLVSLYIHQDNRNVNNSLPYHVWLTLERPFTTKKGHDEQIIPIPPTHISIDASACRC